MTRRSRALVGCGALAVVALGAATPWGLHVRAGRDLARPVLVRNRLIDPRDGSVVKEIPGAAPEAVAQPDDARGPGFFAVASLAATLEYLSVDASTGEVERGPHDEETVSGMRLTRFDKEGKELWAADLPGSLDPKEEWFSTGAGALTLAWRAHSPLCAFDRSTGRLLWQSVACLHEVQASRDLVLGVSGAKDLGTGALVGLEAATGAERFTIPLPKDGGVSVIVAGDLLVEDGTRHARFFDRRGALRFDLAEYVSTAIARPEGVYVFATDALSLYGRASDAPIWRNADLKTRFLDNSSLLPLDGGDALALEWGGATADVTGQGFDTRVTAARVNPRDGTARWTARLASSGTRPSPGDQVVYAELRGERVVVVSQSPCGSFVAVLALATGKLERRFDYPEQHAQR